ncbi:DUF3291 domain-containing protein [Actinomycetospora lemnae]|uniref:DUF3291 domain-containing protein n=1 Tax=Actinomycetospora lemnae TaxID=3019891 RepID=A0ABT5SS69_9PSEU|nr:DUF3291 domain-containing protein [Actinomycetospora sp. DW7H6]MDD7965698.1 DUF3291 domain-containing protein [Actinomycetospora sp. DW7H6]
MQLAQVNVARLRHPVDDPRLAGFLAVVDRVNRLADVTPGFVWRDPEAHRGLHRPPDGAEPLTVVNLSVWEDDEALHRFVYRGPHGQLVRRQREWLLPSSGPPTALWWVRDGERPTPDAALARLAHLRRHGPTPRAFSMKRRFDPAGAPVVTGGARRRSVDSAT